jgi:DNA polymerase-3 subunit delta
MAKSSKPTPTFYLLHGEDEFNRKAYLRALRDKMNDPNQLNTTVLDGSQVLVMAAINAARSMPFLSDKRLVIVEGLLGAMGTSKAAKADLETLARELGELPDFARLVLHESKDIEDKHPICQLAKDHPRGFEKKFSIPKGDRLLDWIISQADKVYGVQIELEAAKALATVIQGDARVADSELAKLAAYVNYSRPITEKDVAAMTAYVEEANVFQMVDAIGLQNGREAIRLAQNLLVEGGNDPLQLFAMIQRQFRMLLLAKEHLDKGGAPHELGEVVGMRFGAERLQSQAKRFRLEFLEWAYHKLAEMDDNIKTGKMDSEVALHIFIAGVTQ